MRKAAEREATVQVAVLKDSYRDIKVPPASTAADQRALGTCVQVETYRRLAKLAAKEDQEGAQYIMLTLGLQIAIFAPNSIMCVECVDTFGASYDVMYYKRL